MLYLPNLVSVRERGQQALRLESWRILEGDGHLQFDLLQYNLQNYSSILNCRFISFDLKKIKVYVVLSSSKSLQCSTRFSTSLFIPATMNACDMSSPTPNAAHPLDVECKVTKICDGSTGEEEEYMQNWIDKLSVTPQ